jgi:hypothetical protein
MFERSESINLDPQELEDYIDDHFLSCNSTEIKDKIQAFYDSNSHYVSSNNNQCSCYCCESYVDKQYITIVEGVYKFQRKNRSSIYHLCPICLYVCKWHDGYANLCGKICTEDTYGKVQLAYRPSSFSFSDWCFVHSTEVRQCSEYGCLDCRIDERFVK